MKKEELTKEVIALLHERFKDEWPVGTDVTADSNLKDDLGFDSLDILDVVSTVELHYGFRMKHFPEKKRQWAVADDATLIRQARTIGDIVNIVSLKKPELCDTQE